MIRIHILLICFATCIRPVLAQDSPSREWIERIARTESMQPRHFSESLSVERNYGYDVGHYRCVWEIDPAIRFIRGNIRTLFRTNSPSVDSIRFDLHRDLQVDSVVVRALKLPFRHRDDVLHIALPVALDSGVVDSVCVYYQGIPTTSGFGSFVHSDHQGIPVMWTLSEPYGSSDWWPCKNQLDDKADSLDMFIQTPVGYRAAGIGLLESEQSNGTSVIHHWKHRYPITSYLIGLAVSNYAQFELKGPDGIPILHYVYPEDSASFRGQAAAVIPMMQLFDSLFGSYPFADEKYGHCQFGWGGGIEHQTFSFVGSLNFELVAHELAHQWFGDKITCGSWEDIWLNEGLATYLSGLCYERILPEWWRRFREVRIEHITSQPGGSVKCTDTTDVNRIFNSRLSYSKGSMVLHQLRWILGDSAFFAALHAYANDSLLSYKTALTPDLIRHFEQAAQRELDWYFDDWYLGSGYPQYRIRWQPNAAGIDLEIQQTPSDPSVSFFELPLPVRIKNAQQDTLVVLEHLYSGQVFQIPLPFSADSIILDPELWLIQSHQILTSVQHEESDDGFHLAPNPAKDRISVYQLTPQVPFSIQLYDPFGHLILSRDQLFEAEGILDLSGLSSGIYFLHCADLHHRKIFKLVKE